MSGDETLADVIAEFCRIFNGRTIGSSGDRLLDEREGPVDEGIIVTAIVAAVNEGRIPPIVPEGKAVMVDAGTYWEQQRYDDALHAELAELRALKAKVDTVADLLNAEGVQVTIDHPLHAHSVYDGPSLVAWLREPSDG